MLTRRRVLLLGAAGLVTVPGIRLALAAAPTENRVVVVVLRGALDGLAAVPPYADKDYANQRGSLAFAVPGQDKGCLDLDGHFGLNPALGDLLPLWQQGELAVIHAAATSYRARSHFDGQDMLETGGADGESQRPVSGIRHGAEGAIEPAIRQRMAGPAGLQHVLAIEMGARAIGGGGGMDDRELALLP